MWRRLFPSSPDGMLWLHTQHSTLISIEHSRYIDWIIRRNVSSTAHPAAYIYTAARTPFPAVMMFCVDDMWRPIYTLCVCVSAVYDDILSLHFYFLLFLLFRDFLIPVSGGRTLMRKMILGSCCSPCDPFFSFFIMSIEKDIEAAEKGINSTVT